MVSIIVVIAAFLIMYVITFIRQVKRNRNDETNSVEQFHNNYRTYQNEALRKYKNTDRNKYITRYNSSEDYREK